MEELELKAYPLDDGFICSMTLSAEAQNNFQQTRKSLSGGELPRTVVILDRSGSMGDSVRQIVNEVLPAFFQKLSYGEKNRIQLITFDSNCETFKCKVGELKHLPVADRGCTYMSPAVVEFGNIFQTFDKSKPVRVLTISDGEVHDPNEVITAGAQLLAITSTFVTPINSQAVRLFTSSNQPDTTALCSLLQINNTTSSNLLDLPANLSSEAMAQQLTDLFLNDGLSDCLELRADAPTFKKFPWDTNASDKFALMAGENVFWISNEIPKKLTIEGVSVKISVDTKLDKSIFYKLLDSKIDYIVDRMKILNVVGTEEAKERANVIYTYFDKTESLFEHTTTETFSEMQLNCRVKKMIATRRKRISFLLSSIANDDNVSKLNSAQRADYLRQTETLTSASRGLAKRAAKEGLNFDEIARDEVKAMAKHFDEIKDIDDSNHLISFFSQDTTLGGIKALIELSEDENFDLFDVHEMLEILNVVGVACKGPIGDFPDPSKWSADQLFVGCNVSLSDVMVAFKQSNGKSLEVPAHGDEITNVIPVFDDARIGIFMKKYAPSLLGYTFSIGMRRMIADVPMTIGYTMSAGIWRMMSELNQNKSSLHVDVFKKFISTFDRFVGKYFDFVQALLKPQESEDLMFYLANNGTCNLIHPLMQIHKTKDDEKLKLVPAILRSLFSFEVWQIIRRSYKQDEDNFEKAARLLLYKLLGMGKHHKILVKAEFEDEPMLEDIKFHDKIAVDEILMEKLTARVTEVNQLALIPVCFRSAFDESAYSFNSIPSLTNELVLKTLEIDYDYKTFIFLNVYQALRFTTRASREDTETEKMKILDLKNKQAVIADIKSFIRSKYKDDYLTDLAEKRKLEMKIMGDEVAAKILSSKTYDEMISVWRDGILRNNVVYKMENTSSSGFKGLMEKICNIWHEVPQRQEIIRVLLLGIDKKSQPVWNRGGASLFGGMSKIQKAFLKGGKQTEWTEVKGKLKGKTHVYRDLTNRHGHDNSKLSYWAMGYTSLFDYKNSATAEEFKLYCENHSDCCGVRHLTASDRNAKT